MRLLTIANCPLERTQGSGYVILGYADGLRARGWRVDVLGPEHVDPWPSLGRARGWRIAIGMWRHAERMLARGRYDVVEFWGGESWLAISRLAAQPGRRFLLVSRSNGLEPACSEQLVRWLGTDTLDGRPRRWYQRGANAASARGFAAADALVTVSEYDREYALAAGWQPEPRVLALDNPLADDFLGQPVDLDRAARIVYCGSWIPRKGIALLVSDLAGVLREHRDARLRLIGVGAGFDAGAHFGADLASRIEVVPFLASRVALRAAYRECSIAVVPSVYESFGLVAAEAMACGCALVATRTGFAASLRDGVEASLLDAPLAPQLRERTSTLLRDDARRRAIARGGHARVQSLRWAVAVDALAAAYRRWHAGALPR